MNSTRHRRRSWRAAVTRRVVWFVVAAGAGLFPAPAFTADAGALPPDIAEITRKVERGERPTPEDLRRVEEFARSRAASPAAKPSVADSLPPPELELPPVSGICRCIDLGTIRHRLEEIRTAVLQYRRELQRLPANAPFSVEGYRHVQIAVEAALNRHSYDFPPVGHALGQGAGEREPAATDAFCSTSVTPAANACETVALQRHQSVHHERCERVKGWNRLGNPFKGMLLRDVILEEIEASKAEETFLLLELTRLDPRCLVWSGTITYESVDKRSSSRTDPVLTADGTKTTVRHFELRRAATIRLAEMTNKGLSPASVNFSLDSGEDSSGSGSVRCRVRGKYVDRAVSWKSRNSTSGTAAHTADARVSVRVWDDGRYDIGFSVPMGPVGLSVERTASRTGGCDDEPSKPVTETGSSQSDGGGTIEAHIAERTDRGRLEPAIRGSKTETLGTITTTITWDLKRHLAGDAR